METYRIHQLALPLDAGPDELRRAIEAPAEAAEAKFDVDATRARFTGEPRDAKWQTAALRKSGLSPGPTFSWCPLHWVNEGEALYHIARFGEPDMAAEAVERFQNAVGPESDAVPLLEPPNN